MTGGTVSAVEPGSQAARMGVRPGDVLIEVNGHPLRDVLDVQFYAAEERLALTVARDGRQMTFRAKRDYSRPLGLDFDSVVFDGMRLCGNHCDFCFVSQMPRGMRRSLYVRDDDYRYSVLYGSFVTLTRLTASDWDRLDEQRLSPLYLSVHATDHALRAQLLGRADVPDVLEQIDRLAEMHIQMHTQVVLVPGVNDGAHLEQTVADLAARYPAVASVGVVPVGLTRYHRGGCRLYSPVEAAAVVEQVARMQERYRAEHGVSLVYLADEWYLRAGIEVPDDELYDDYDQVENGVGLVRQFLDDSEAIQPGRVSPAPREVTLVCGTLIAPIMRRVAARVEASVGGGIRVLPVTNHLFGETVTVSGLLGGRDVLSALEGVDPGDLLVLPRAMFSAQQEDDGAGSGGEELVTLDDVTLGQIAAQVGPPVRVADRLTEVWS